MKTKTLADVRRRLQRPGIRLQCLAFGATSAGPEDIRLVTKVQTNGFWWLGPLRTQGRLHSRLKSFTDFPAAADVQWLDDLTVVFVYASRPSLTLRFLPPVPAPSALTREDWTEIFYALETKVACMRRGDYGKDEHAWIAQLEAIMAKIGPDGVHMLPPEASA